MSKRKPVLPELTSVLLSREQHINEPDVPARAELRAAESVIRAARAAEKARRLFAQHVPGCTWDYWIGNCNALKVALARLDRVTGRDEP